MKRTAVAGAGVALLSKFSMPSVKAAANSPTNLAKWIQPLRGLDALGDPNGIPVATPGVDPVFNKANGYPYDANFYQIGVGEFQDKLHPDLPPTTLWGYYDMTRPIKRHLGGVMVVERGTPTRARFTNMLPDRHILPVDTTLPGANLAHNRIALHLHGGYVPWMSDGGPFDWWTPAGKGNRYTTGLSFVNGPTSKKQPNPLDNIPGMPLVEGQADYWYPNDQSCRLMWYHDHAHGTTRLNAYAGLATGYLVLDAINDVYAGGNRLNGIPGTSKIPGLVSTIPLVLQDKVFVSATTPLTDPSWATVARPDLQGIGSLWYEHVYDPNVFMLQAGGLPLPDPSCVPEFFGDTMLCNGTVHPLLTVEAKRYRFMLLNACNSRFVNLNLFKVSPQSAEGIVLNPKTLFPKNPPGPAMIQIGTEGGFLVREVVHKSGTPVNPATFTGNLVVAPAERADFIIDFTGRQGEEFILYNDAPGPFPGGAPEFDYFLGNPANPVQPLPGFGPDTRQILRFKVVPATAPDPQPAGPILDPMLVDPTLIVPLPPTLPNKGPVPPLPIPAGVLVRDLSLNEEFDQFGRLTQTLGTLVPKEPGAGLGRAYLDPPTEVPQAGDTEVWRFWNLSADTHPVHIHLVNFQILQRQAFAIDPITGAPIWDNATGAPLLSGPARGPELNELGWKETAQMHPGEVITLIMKFDLPDTPFPVPSSPRAASFGLNDPNTTYHEYVYHCHILEHEEHDMMRPICVKKPNTV